MIELDGLCPFPNSLLSQRRSEEGKSDQAFYHNNGTLFLERTGRPREGACIHPLPYASPIKRKQNSKEVRTT